MRVCVSVAASISLISSAAGEERAADEALVVVEVSKNSVSLSLSLACSSLLHSSSERNLPRLFFLLSSLFTAAQSWATPSPTASRRSWRYVHPRG